MRKTPFVEDEYYHIYNRGVDKRSIFLDEDDVQRFYTSVKEFNVLEPIGSIYENSFAKKLGSWTSKPVSDSLVNLTAHCVNPNHFHLLLKQETEKGIEKFMHRIGTGYTKYFNSKYKRSGALFQGRFKSVHVDSNEYLLHVSAYINLNDRVHQLGSPTSKLVRSRSSWREYTDERCKGICEKDIVLKQFKSIGEYKKFAFLSLELILERKEKLKDIGEFLLE
jgi:REP element-mobilizing transposase RayT